MAKDTRLTIRLDEEHLKMLEVVKGFYSKNPNGLYYELTDSEVMRIALRICAKGVEELNEK